MNTQEDLVSAKGGLDAESGGVCVRVLLPDGGQMEPPEEEEASDEDESGADESAEGDDESEAEEEDAAEAEEEDEAGEADETEEPSADEETPEAAGDEAEEAETEREAATSDEGARILHLKLDRVFLDLLGLEVDLDTVTLDVTAVTGESKLLGNLLSAVSGLFDGNPLGDLLPDNPLSGLFGGGEGDGEDSDSGLSLPGLPEFDPMGRARALAGSIAETIRNAVDEAASSIIDALPLEELLAQFLQAIVEQLLESSEDEGGESKAEATASSA